MHESDSLSQRRVSPGKITLALAAVVVGAWWVRHVCARAVRKWRPGGGKFVRAGKVVARISGAGDRAFVLLHGLVASSDTFGAEYDRLAEYGKLIVPDLLGFGRSMCAAAPDFALDAQLDALDKMLVALGLADAELVIVGHSLGGVLALHWAGRHRARVDAVITFGAPLFRNDAEARKRLKAMGVLESLFAHDSDFARRACELMCRFRRTAGVLAVALSPDLPTQISHRAVQHTSPAYCGAMSVFSEDWESALRQLDAAAVLVKLIAGSDDESQVLGLADQLALRFTHVQAEEIPHAAHILPLTHGERCVVEVLESLGSSNTTSRVDY